MPLKIGFIGLGRMGKPIAINVVNAGYDLVVYDLRREQLEDLTRLGAKAAASPQAAAREADIIEIIVVDDEQVEQVLTAPDGVLQGARAKGGFFERSKYLLSTTSLLLVRGKALTASVFTQYEDAADLEWIRVTTLRWIDELKRLNSR